MSTQTPPLPHGPTPNPAQLAWHRRQLYGFIHFTQNTFSDREWGFGDEDPAAFNPTELDCHQWVEAAKIGGLKALVLTAKHHDGFCLWPTATTTHNISRSPFRNGKGDLVRELAGACRDGGLEFGLYCSPWDRNHPEYGRPGYVEVFHAQWKELLSNYGPLCELWFDGANGGDGFYGGAREKRAIDARSYYRMEELWETCATLQPQAVRFSDGGPDIRWCGNESGYNGFTSWCKVDPKGVAPGLVDNHDRLPLGEAEGTVWRPVEVDVSIRPGWFYHPHERPRSGEELFNIWLSSVGQNAGLILNLAPDRRGLVPAEDLAALNQFKHRVASFTGVNLAPSAARDTSATAAGTPGALVDGQADTYWAAQDPLATITLDLGEATYLGGIRIDEAIVFGQRVTAFTVETQMWQSWTEVFRGTTIGAQRIIRFNQVQARKIRVRVLDTQNAPVFSTIEVYGISR